MTREYTAATRARCDRCGARHRSIDAAARCAFPRAEVRPHCDPCGSPRALLSLYSAGRGVTEIIHIAEAELVEIMLASGRRSGTHLGGDVIVPLTWSSS